MNPTLLGDRVVTAAEQVIVPLDRVRWQLLRVAGPAVGPWVRSRDLRIAVGASLVATTSLVAAVTAPLVVLALTPIVLGIPHLVADLRILVVKPGLHRELRPWKWLCVGLLGLDVLTADLAWGLLAALVAALAARASVPRRALVAVPLAGLLAADLVWPWQVTVGFAHAHNLVAVALWLGFVWRTAPPGPRTFATRAGPAALVVAGGAAIAGGVFDDLLAWSTGIALPGAASMRTHAAFLAPFGDPTLAVRGVVLFAYAQSVHYGLWLRIIPEETRDRPVPPTLLVSWRSLRQDLGPVVLGLATVLAVGLAAWAAIDLGTARDGYLRLALFHGPLELVFAALVMSGDRSPS